MDDTYSASVRIRDLPRHVDDALNAIALATGRFKWEVICEALTEYAARHKVHTDSRYSEAGQ